MEIEELQRFNSWWKSSKVRDDLLEKFKRDQYEIIKKYLDKRQIILLWGLRRLGKTTIFFQTIDELLKDTNPKNILYFSFDELVFDIKDVLESYQRFVLNKTFEEHDQRVFIFLDEVQKVKDWENKLKTYYDLYPKIKFFLSGSASVSLRKKSKESLAGRIFDFEMTPLSFEEYLKLNRFNIDEIRENPELWKKTLITSFYNYIKIGTFPEIATEKDEEFAKNYIKNNVIERILYKDIPEEFSLKDVELLKTLIHIVAKKPGMIIDYKEIASNLGKDQRTISNYFEYLEFGLLIRFVRNYRGSPIASSRKMKKAYLSTPNIAFSLSSNFDSIFPFILENMVAIKINAKFFYRNGFEVDFVVENEDSSLTAIEVKKNSKEEKQIRKFKEKFRNKAKKGVIVNIEEEGKLDNVNVIPIWKLLLDIN